VLTLTKSFDDQREVNKNYEHHIEFLELREDASKLHRLQ